jgi:hypothetical protein
MAAALEEARAAAMPSDTARAFFAGLLEDEDDVVAAEIALGWLRWREAHPADVPQVS